MAMQCYEDAVDIVGTVLEADVRNARFVIYLDPQDREGIPVQKYTPEQESIVTEALKEHQTRRLRVKGRGEYTPPPERKLRAITQVDDIVSVRSEEAVFDPNERPIWEKLLEIAERIPDEELAKLPRDGAANLDHYLYGSPKR